MWSSENQASAIGAEEYNGDRWTRSSNRERNTYTGLFGQHFSQYDGYAWDARFNWTRGSATGSGLSFIDAFDFSDLEGGDTLNLYGQVPAALSKYVIRYEFYTQKLDHPLSHNLNSDWTLANVNEQRFQLTGIPLNFELTKKYPNGFSPYQYNLASGRSSRGFNVTWTWGQIRGNTANNNQNVNVRYGIRILYKRNTFSISFKDTYNNTITDIANVDAAFSAIPFETELRGPSPPNRTHENWTLPAGMRTTPARSRSTGTRSCRTRTSRSTPAGRRTAIAWCSISTSRTRRPLRDRGRVGYLPSGRGDFGYRFSRWCKKIGDKDYASVGWYTDAGYTKPFNLQTEISDETQDMDMWLLKG